MATPIETLGEYRALHGSNEFNYIFVTGIIEDDIYGVLLFLVTDDFLESGSGYPDDTPLVTFLSEGETTEEEATTRNYYYGCSVDVLEATETVGVPGGTCDCGPYYYLDNETATVGDLVGLIVDGNQNILVFVTETDVEFVIGIGILLSDEQIEGLESSSPETLILELFEGSVSDTSFTMRFLSCPDIIDTSAPLSPVFTLSVEYDCDAFCLPLGIRATFTLEWSNLPPVEEVNVYWEIISGGSGTGQWTYPGGGSTSTGVPLPQQQFCITQGASISYYAEAKDAEGNVIATTDTVVENVGTCP